MVHLGWAQAGHHLVEQEDAGVRGERAGDLQALALGQREGGCCLVALGRKAQLLDQVRRVAATGANLMPAFLEAARARCSVGEIMNALADVFGRYDGAAKW